MKSLEYTEVEKKQSLQPTAPVVPIENAGLQADLPKVDLEAGESQQQ